MKVREGWNYHLLTWTIMTVWPPLKVRSPTVAARIHCRVSPRPLSLLYIANTFVLTVLRRFIGVKSKLHTSLIVQSTTKLSSFNFWFWKYHSNETPLVELLNDAIKWCYLREVAICIPVRMCVPTKMSKYRQRNITVNKGKVKNGVHSTLSLRTPR